LAPRRAERSVSGDRDGRSQRFRRDPRPCCLDTGPVGEPFVGADNIAGVVGAVLTDDGHAGRPNEAAVPRIASFDEAVEQLAEATGRRVRFVRISAERCAALLADHDVPDEVVVRLTRVLATLLDGGNARPEEHRACPRSLSG
jgi:uncharacterized protein YbjT (DUF2867 family)